NDLPDGHALREIQVNGPAPILHRKHADSNPDAQASNFPSASPNVRLEQFGIFFVTAGLCSVNAICNG
ncbi:hypothetical protein, partial [Bifidobacterium sp. WCA-178-WT-4B]|uniref:hypothetical protein n=1 Tax=Bifidobacterium sp. WCA-178-WT-4B TaxID=2605776 RepID=UPI001E4E3F8E